MTPERPGERAPSSRRGRAAILGALLAASAVAVALGASDDAPDPRAVENAFLAGEPVGDPASPFEREYVGYDPAAFDPARPWSEARVLQEARAWLREHRTDTVLEANRVEVDGALIGYAFVFVSEGDIPGRALPPNVPKAPKPRDPLTLDA